MYNPPGPVSAFTAISMEHSAPAAAVQTVFGLPSIAFLKAEALEDGVNLQLFVMSDANGDTADVARGNSSDSIKSAANAA
jgi:hypothetical protein